MLQATTRDARLGPRTKARLPDGSRTVLAAGGVLAALMALRARTVDGGSGECNDEECHCGERAGEERA